MTLSPQRVVSVSCSSTCFSKRSCHWKALLVLQMQPSFFVHASLLSVYSKALSLSPISFNSFAFHQSRPVPSSTLLQSLFFLLYEQEVSPGKSATACTIVNRENSFKASKTFVVKILQRFLALS